LRYLLPEIADAAAIQRDEGSDYWKITVAPRTAGACPFELMLRTDRTYDLAVAGELYEEQRTDDLELFAELVRSLASGRVIQRVVSSRMTGEPLSIETRIATDGHGLWRRERQLAPAMPPGETELRDRHFLPYRRKR